MADRRPLTLHEAYNGEAALVGMPQRHGLCEDRSPIFQASVDCGLVDKMLFVFPCWEESLMRTWLMDLFPIVSLIPSSNRQVNGYHEERGLTEAVSLVQSDLHLIEPVVEVYKNMLGKEAAEAAVSSFRNTGKSISPVIHFPGFQRLKTAAIHPMPSLCHQSLSPVSTSQETH